MARVLIERNQYKESWLELQKAVNHVNFFVRKNILHIHLLLLEIVSVLSLVFKFDIDLHALYYYNRIIFFCSLNFSSVSICNTHFFRVVCQNSIIPYLTNSRSFFNNTNQNTDN